MNSFHGSIFDGVLVNECSSSITVCSEKAISTAVVVPCIKQFVKTVFLVPGMLLGY